MRIDYLRAPVRLIRVAVSAVVFRRGVIPQLQEPAACLSVGLKLLLLMKLVDLREIGLLVVKAFYPFGVLTPCLVLEADLFKERPVERCVEVGTFS